MYPSQYPTSNDTIPIQHDTHGQFPDNNNQWMDVFPERSLEMKLIFLITTISWRPEKLTRQWKIKTTILPKKNGSVFSPIQPKKWVKNFPILKKEYMIWMTFSHGKKNHPCFFGEKKPLQTAAPCLLQPNRNLSDGHRRCPETRPTLRGGEVNNKKTRQISFQIKPKNKSDKKKVQQKLPKMRTLLLLLLLAFFVVPRP